MLTDKQTHSSVTGELKLPSLPAGNLLSVCGYYYGNISACVIWLMFLVASVLWEWQPAGRCSLPADTLECGSHLFWQRSSTRYVIEQLLFPSGFIFIPACLLLSGPISKLTSKLFQLERNERWLWLLTVDQILLHLDKLFLHITCRNWPYLWLIFSLIQFFIQCLKYPK